MKLNIQAATGLLAGNTGILALTNRNDLRQMSQDEMKTYVIGAMAESKGEDLTPLCDDLAREVAVFSIFRKRLEVLRIPFSPALAVALVSHIQNPAVAVMWAYTLAVWTQKLGRVVTIEDFSHPQAFGFGIPKLEALQRIWVAQKGYSQEPPIKTDNCLDKMECWPRLVTPEPSDEVKSDG